jgi:tetratricopeptide (TPR) repeat protein
VGRHSRLLIRHNQICRFMPGMKVIMRVCICCCVALLMIGSQPRPLLYAQASGQQKADEPTAPPLSPLSSDDKANELSDQVGKLMVKCVNLLTAQDPLSLDYCKQQRDLADQYPPRERMVDKMLAHDEYGIALAAFDHKKEALEEFNQEVVLVPKAVKPGSTEWSTAYWHRAMIYVQLGETDKADRDYRAAEANFRKASFNSGEPSAEKKRRAILRQHAALLQKEGKTAAAHQLLEEAAK